MKRFALTITTFVAVAWVQLALAGPMDPDCTAEKAAKSAATKAAVGVGGRCSPAEAAKDSAKDAVGIEDKGPIEKQRDGATPVDASKKVVKKVNQ